MEETLKKITEENLNKIDESEWDYKIFDYILEEKIGDNYQEKAGIIEKLPIGLKFWYATWELESEVYNGGFNQYFYNTLGEFIENAIDGYRYFELNEIADIVENAAKVAIGEINIIVDAKKKGTLESFSEIYEESELGEFDNKFYVYEKEIEKSRIRKLEQSIKDFID